MNIQNLKSNTTWQEASNTINNNNNKISLAIATLENATLKNKGYFTSVEKLKEAIPNPTIGSKAYVGTSEPYAIYIVENGVWVDSGYTGGDEIVAKITTDRIEDGAITSEKIATSAFDSTLSVSGKIAPADVVGGKLTDLESESNKSYSSVSYLLNFFPNQTINASGEFKPSFNDAVSELIKVESNTNLTISVGDQEVAQYVLLCDDSSHVLEYYTVVSERAINTANASYIQFGFSLKDINIVSVKDGENTIWAPKHDEIIEGKLEAIVDGYNYLTKSIVGNYPNYIENSILNKYGNTNNHATFSTSQLINIAAATEIKIFYGATTENSMAVVYDEKKEFLDYFTLAPGAEYRTIDTNGYSYVRFSFNKAGRIEDENGEILWQPQVFSNEIKDNSDKINYIINYMPDTTISLNGDISKLKGIALSDYIPVNGDMSYRCVVGYNVEGVIALYDANKQYFDYYTVGIQNNERSISAVGASYIRIPFNILNIRDVKVTLNGEVVWSPNINVGIKGTMHTYDGEPIILQSLEYYTMLVNPCEGLIQDACCYKDTMFQFFLQETYDNPACIVYDLITGEKIQEMDVPHGYYSHNNSAVFGSEKYDESDEFPLLYLSTLQRVAGQPTIDVFRITGTRGNYQCELVQTITIEKTISYYREPTCFIDKQENELYVIWITGEVDTVEKYSLPKLSDGDNIVIPVSSKLDTFTISNRYPYGTTIGEPEQGGEIYHGKLYYAMGFKSCSWLIVVDLHKKKIVSSIDFTGIGLDYEPEGAFVWRGNLCVPFNESAKVVRFSF